MTASSLTIRPARPVTDDWAVAALAGLDSARPLSGAVLLAEADGRPVAAVAVADGRAVADPFQPSAAAVAVLRVRAAQLRAGSPTGASARRRLRLRLASG
jgi:hypothetical protein